MPVVSVSLSESLLQELDELVEEHRYSGRSEAFRKGVRGLLAEVNSDEESREVVCVVAVLFEYGSGAEIALSELRHDHEELLQTNVHSCTGSGCLECFVVEGSTDQLDSFVATLRSIEGIQAVERTVVSTRRPVVTHHSSHSSIGRRRVADDG